MPCREHLAQLREHGEEIAGLGAVVAVTFEDPPRIRRFVERERIPFPVLSDRDRRGYAAFGLGRANPGELWTLKSLRAYVQGALRGRLPASPLGDVAQLGGDVVLDPGGRVVWIHRSAEPADRPDVRTIVRALRDAGSSSAGETAR